MLTKEPVEADNPLNSVKDSTKLIVTPHIAWATVEARTRLMDEVYEILRHLRKVRHAMLSDKF